MLLLAYLMAGVLTLAPQAHSYCTAQSSLQRFDPCLVPQTPGEQGTVLACAPRRAAGGSQATLELWDHLHSIQEVRLSHGTVCWPPKGGRKDLTGVCITHCRQDWCTYRPYVHDT